MTVAPDGTIYIAWAARCPAGPGCSRTKVLLAKSTNGGDSWRTPMLVSQRIATGTEDPRDPFFPWGTGLQDGPDTAVRIVFYDRSYDTTRLGSCTVACTVDQT